MAQPLSGLSAAQRTAYLELMLHGSYQPRWRYVLHDLNDRPLADVTIPVPEDGEISVNADDEVTRSTTGTVWDPEGQVQVDTENPDAGSLHLDRILQIRHTVTVPALGGFDVTVVPFYGWLTKADRDGDTIRLEAQGLERRAMFGCPPMNVQARTPVVDAIRAIMIRRCGERRFRIATSSRARLLKAVAVGWKPESSPWAVVRRLAASIDHQVFYSADGFLTLRPYPTQPSVTFTWPDPGSGEPGSITAKPKSSTDALALINYTRAGGKGKIVAASQAPAAHPLSPQRLARHGVPLYMPRLLDSDKWTTKRQAKTASARSLEQGLAQVYDQELVTTPLYHLDPRDRARIETPLSTAVADLRSWKMTTVAADITWNRKLRLRRPNVAVIRG